MKGHFSEDYCMKKILGSILTILGAGIIILSLIVKVNGQMAFSVAGGVDGPTSISLAGIVGGNLLAEIIVGAILVAIGFFILVRRQ
jgi:oxaloacetate decarboxylase beta subunit